MNLPPEANVALIDFMSAIRRYNELLAATILCGLEYGHPATLETEACVRDAEQALLTIFTVCFGEPTVAGDEGETEP